MMFESLADARLLVEVGRYLNFAQAARNLKMPPATVSRRIALLEESIQTKLFERTTRKVRLTEAGEMLTRYAQRILDEADAASSAIEAMQSEPTGEVRLSAPVVLGQGVLGPIVREFLALHPKCRVSVNLTNRQVDLVEEGYDLAIRARQPGNADLMARKLGSAATALYADAVHGTLDIRDPGQIAGRQFALSQPERNTRERLFLSNPKHGRQEVPIVCRMWSTNPWVVCDAIRDTPMIAMLPCLVGANDPQLRRVLEGWNGASVDIFAVFVSRRLMRPSVRAFLDLLSDRVPDRINDPHCIT